jgi:hypothetical protein
MRPECDGLGAASGKSGSPPKAMIGEDTENRHHY